MLIILRVGALVVLATLARLDDTVKARREVDDAHAKLAAEEQSDAELRP